jgi:hypothetical protein
MKCTWEGQIQLCLVHSECLLSSIVTSSNKPMHAKASMADEAAIVRSSEPGSSDEQATALGVALVEGLARGMSLATGLAMGAGGGHAP